MGDGVFRTILNNAASWAVRAGGMAAVAAALLWPRVSWAQDDSGDINAELIGQLLDTDKLIVAFLIIGSAWVISRLAGATLDRIGEQVATRRLLIKKVASLTRFLIYLGAALLVVFGVIQPERHTLLALATALGLVIGLALQDLIGSIIAGVIILIDSPFQVGDRVAFGDVYGEVAEIGLRTVRINTLDDNLISIPNNKFLTDVVSSGNAGELNMMVVIDLHIGTDEDFMLAKRLAYEAAITSKYTFLEKPVAIHLRDVSTPNGFATRVRVKLYVIDVRYEVAIVTDITERIKAAYREHNIRPPYHDRRSMFIPMQVAPPMLATAAPAGAAAPGGVVAAAQAMAQSGAQASWAQSGPLIAPAAPSEVSEVSGAPEAFQEDSTPEDIKEAKAAVQGDVSAAQEGNVTGDGAVHEEEGQGEADEQGAGGDGEKDDGKSA